MTTTAVNIDLGFSPLNTEGYPDPTAFTALKNLQRAEYGYRRLVYICSPYSGDVENNVELAEWVTPESLAKRMAGVALMTATSRNHQRAKGVQSARPRFHVSYLIAAAVTVLVSRNMEQHYPGLLTKHRLNNRDGSENASAYPSDTGDFGNAIFSDIRQYPENSPKDSAWKPPCSAA